MPLMPGIRMSRTIAAKSCRSMREQRLVGRLWRARAAPAAVEHRLERVEVPRLVVDDQHLDVFVRHGLLGNQRYSHTRSSDSSWSVFTGLAM